MELIKLGVISLFQFKSLKSKNVVASKLKYYILVIKAKKI